VALVCAHRPTNANCPSVVHDLSYAGMYRHNSGEFVLENSRSSPVTRMLRRREVELRTGLKRSTIYEHMANGAFPKPIRIGARVVCWPEHEIQAWLQEQVKRSRGTAS